MIIDKINEYTVYESPDGGKTVYARKQGESQRVLHYVDPEVIRMTAKIAEDLLWENIRAAAEKNLALQKALDNAIMIYNLSKTNEQ